MKPFIATALVCVMALAGSLAQAQEGSARDQLNRFSEDLTTLQARFEQRVISSDSRIEDATAGEVWLKRPGLFRWAYGGDFPELVVADGRNIWIYDEALDQVTVKGQAEAAANSPLNLLTDLTRLDSQFEVREVGDADNQQLLELRSRSSESEFERILLGFSGDQLQMMVMEDAFGLRTEIRFSQLQRNPELEPGLFTFDPPESADVIGEIQR